MVQIPLPSTTTPAGQRRMPVPAGPGRGAAAAKSAAAAAQRPDLFGVEPLVMPFTIQYDHRERAGGWRFSGLMGVAADKYRPLIVPTTEIHMVTGDYTVEGVPVFVERKSTEDFLSTIIHGRENFIKEHDRMVAIRDAGGSCCVVIEGEAERIIAELESGNSPRGIHPNSVRGSIAAFNHDYGIPWLFAGSRRSAEEMAFAILRKAWERTLEKK